MYFIAVKSPSLIKIEAPIKPVPFKRVMTNGRRRYNSAGYTEFKEELGYFASLAMQGQEPFKGKISLRAEFYKKRKGIEKAGWGDVDNFLKAVMDALNGICYVDDGQVIKVSGEKKIGEPHIFIELEETK